MKERQFLLFYKGEPCWHNGHPRARIFNATELRQRLQDVGSSNYTIEEIFTKPVKIETKTIYTFEEN